MTAEGGSTVRPKPPSLEIPVPRPPSSPRVSVHGGAATDRGGRAAAPRLRPQTAPERNGSQSARSYTPSGQGGGEDLFQKLHRQMRAAQKRVLHYERAPGSQMRAQTARSSTRGTSSLLGSARLMNNPRPPSTRSDAARPSGSRQGSRQGSRGYSPGPSSGRSSRHSDAPSLSEGWVQWQAPTLYRQEVRSRAMDHVAFEERKFRTASRAVFEKRVEEVEVDLFERLGPQSGNSRGKAAQAVKDRIHSIARHKVSREMSLALESRKLTDWDFRKVVEVKEKEYQEELREMRAASRYEAWTGYDSSRPPTQQSYRTDTPGGGDGARVSFAAEGGRPGASTTTTTSHAPYASGDRAVGSGRPTPDGGEPLPEGGEGGEGADHLGILMEDIADAMEDDTNVLNDSMLLWTKLRARFREAHASLAAEAIGAVQVGDESDQDKLWASMIQRRKEAARMRQYSMARWAAKTPAQVELGQVEGGPKKAKHVHQTARDAYLWKTSELGIPQNPSILACCGKSRLEVAGRTIDDATMEALGEAMRQADWKAIEAVDVGDTGMRDRVAAQFLNELKFKPVTSLNMAGNGIGMRGAKELVNGFQAAIGPLHPVNSAERQMWRTLEVLELGGNHLGNRAVSVLASALCNTGRAVHTLGLRKNNVTDSCARSLGDLLSYNGSITSLDLSWNNLRAESAKQVAAALRQNAVLRHLDLSWNGIGDEGGTYVGWALAENGSLTSLDMSQTQIRNGTCLSLAFGLDRNKTLEVMGMGNNNVGGVGGQVLARVLKERGDLVVNGLPTCSLATSERQRLPDVVEKRRGGFQLGCQYRLDLATTVGRALAPLLIRHDVAGGEKTWVNVTWKGRVVKQYHEMVAGVDGKRMSVKDLGWHLELPDKGILEVDVLLDTLSTFQEPWGKPENWKMESLLGEYDMELDRKRGKAGGGKRVTTAGTGAENIPPGQAASKAKAGLA